MQPNEGAEGEPGRVRGGKTGTTQLGGGRRRDWGGAQLTSLQDPAALELERSRVGRLVLLKGPLGGGASVSGRGRPPQWGPGGASSVAVHSSCVFV